MNRLNYSCRERSESSCMEDYKVTFDGQETYRMPRRRGRPVANNAARERSRVKTLRSAFLDLQRSLPAVPPDTKLSKLDVLVLATTYIAHLMRTLQENGDTSKTFATNGGMHPVKVIILFLESHERPGKTYIHDGLKSHSGPTLTVIRLRCSPYADSKI